MFFKNWGEIDERLDPLFYLNMLILNENIVKKSKHDISTFKQKVNMQRGRFGHRPRNDPRYYGGKYPFIQTGNVVKASQANERIEYSQTLNDLGLSTSRLFDERVLVITIAANIGYTAILDYNACFPDSLVALTAKENDISIDYLNAYIRLIRTYIENLAPQAAQKNINLKQMSKLPIIVPGENIQNLIVEIMNKAYTNKISKENETQALLDSIDDYLLDELGITMPEENENQLENRMFFINSRDVINNRFDQDYYADKYKKINQAIDKSPYSKLPLKKITESIFNGKTPSSDDYSEEKTEYTLIKVSSYTANYIDLNNISYSKSPLTKNICKDDIFILSAAHQSSYVGKFIKYLKDNPVSNISFVGELICVRANQLIEPLLLFSILSLNIYKDLLNREKRGQTAHIYPKDISKILIPIPDKNTQIKMVNFISDTFERIELIEKESAAIFKEAEMRVQELLLGGDLS